MAGLFSVLSVVVLALFFSGVTEAFRNSTGLTKKSSREMKGPSIGEPASLCRQSERFLSCGGCQGTCRDPAPACAAVCREGCYCNEGEVRDDDGHCIQLADCVIEPFPASDTSEPRPHGVECPPHEEYRYCEPCSRTCDNPDPVCPAQCARGCFCSEGLVRNRDGACVAIDKCPKKENSNYIQPSRTYTNDVELTCGPNQQFRSCETCEKTCSNPNPSCPTPCARGCFCEDGLVKSPSGQCVQLEDCPQAVETFSGHGPTIEDCGSAEEYLSCGWCEATCSQPDPQCPQKVCTRGCLCRPPLVRHRSGLCVDEKDCGPKKCPSDSEEYVCRHGCEARCDQKPCVARARACALGCHCRPGLFRDHQGRCVPFDECFADPIAVYDID